LTIDWGAVPDWIAGVGAVSALAFAALAVRAANQQNKHQAVQLEKLEADQRERDKDRHRAQAEKVAAWHERISEMGGPSPFPIAYDAFIVRNASDVPVYSAWVAASGPRSDHENFAIGNLDVVPPGSHSLVMRHVSELKVSEFTPRVLVMFRDSGGRCWLRRENGLLEERDEATWNRERQVLILARENVEESIRARVRPLGPGESP
jgi:hypothetical protein